MLAKQLAAKITVIKKAWKIRADIYTVRKSGNFPKMLSGNDAEKKAGQRSASMHGN